MAGDHKKQVCNVRKIKMSGVDGSSRGGNLCSRFVSHTQKEYFFAMVVEQFLTSFFQERTGWQEL